MNRIARTAANIVVATGFATAALTLTGTAAHAEGPNNGPGTLQMGPIVDPDGPVIVDAPAPEPQPEPQAPVDGLDEISDAPHCTHGCGGDKGDKDEPGDAAPAPESDPVPDQGCFEGCDLPETDQGCFEGCDLPETDPKPASEPASAPGVITPNRVDAGQDDALTTSVPSVGASDDTGLGWYVGLGLFSIAGALGVALAARKLAEKNRTGQHA